jgi:hypothetical protein
MFELDGKYFAEDVTREFGENRVVAGHLTVVYPVNDYVRENGRNLTVRAADGSWLCAKGHPNYNQEAAYCLWCDTPRR